MTHKRASVLCHLALLLAGFAVICATADGGGKSVLAITINGAINPVVAEHISKAITSAEADPSIEALVIEMDTPGGLDTSMRQIVKDIRKSQTPVIVYVSPSGSRAASAGAFIAYASHVTAMAPGTNIGAASPVNLGGEGMDKTMKHKVTNDAAAYIRSMAEATGRNPDIGEAMVRKGSSIPETEALKNNVVELIAKDFTELLNALDGRTVKTSAGERKLATKGLPVKRVEMNFRQKIFDALANPNIAYMLMMLGFYGLFFELSNPGAVLPGLLGAVSLILAFYSLQTLPINYAGALLIMMALIMFMLEVWVPSYGMLTLGGLAALVMGSLMLVDSPEEYLRISLTMILPISLFTAGFFFLLVGSGVRAQGAKVVTGMEGMMGAGGYAETDIAVATPGKVFVEGDIWNAVTKGEPIPKDGRVRVVDMKGLTLTVEKAD
jgi:membrane-bound serine protease (ClpP class)